MDCTIVQNPTESQLRTLSKVEPADRQEVWNEAIELAREEGKKLGAKHVEEAVNQWKLNAETLQRELIDANQKQTYTNAITSQTLQALLILFAFNACCNSGKD